MDPSESRAQITKTVREAFEEIAEAAKSVELDEGDAAQAQAQEELISRSEFLARGLFGNEEGQEAAMEAGEPLDELQQAHVELAAARRRVAQLEQQAANDELKRGADNG